MENAINPTGNQSESMQDAHVIEANFATDQPPKDKTTEAYANTLAKCNAVFKSTQLDKAAEAINAVVEACEYFGLEIIQGYDFEKETPEGYGIAITPIQALVKGEGRRVKAVVIGVVPDYEKLVAEKGGLDYLKALLEADLVSQLKRAANKPVEDRTSIPVTVGDYCTTSRGSLMAAFNALAPDFIKVLKGKSDRLQFLSKPMFKQILASTAFAESQFSFVPQTAWVKVLNSMIRHAEAESMDTKQFEHWLETRDSVEMKADEFNFDDLDSLVDSEEGKVSEFSESETDDASA